MLKKTPFVHKKARRIINNEYKGNSRVVDNEGYIYDYVSKLEKKTNGKVCFYAKRADEKEYRYMFFDIDGKSLQDELGLTLFIEEEIDFSKYDILIDDNDCNVAYLNLERNNEYLILPLCDGFKPSVNGIVNSDWFAYAGFREATHEDKDRIYAKLYDIGIGYDPINHITFPIAKELKDGKWYRYYNHLFQITGYYSHDLRNVCSIPYTYCVDIKYGNVYKNSSVGLPKNICIKEADIEEVELALKIVHKYESEK